MQTKRFISPSAAIDFASEHPEYSKTHMLRGRLLIPLENRTIKRDTIASHNVKSQFSHDNFDGMRVFVVGRVSSIRY